VNAERAIGASIEGLSGLETLFRADDIMGAELARCKTRDAEVVIHAGMGETRWYDFHKTPAYIPIGEQVARAKLPEIHRTLEPQPLRRLLQHVWPAKV
jgi:hypothetical protein